MLLATDNIRSIGGLRLTPPMKTELFTDKYKIGDTVRLEVKRGLSEKTLALRLEKYYQSTYFIVSLIVALSFLLPAIIVYIKIEDRTLAVVFHWLLVSAAVMLLFDYGSLRVFPIPLNMLLRIMEDMSYLFLPAIFVHFSFLVPKKKLKNSELIFKLVYFVLAGAVIPVAFINYAYISSNNYLPVLIYAQYSVFFIKPFLILPFVFIIGNFIHSYRTSRVQSDKRKLLWIFVGLFIGPAIYTFLYRLPDTIFHFTIISETTMVLMLALSPASLFVAIFRYRFLDIQLIIKRSFIYGFIIFLLVAVYFAIVNLMNTFAASRSDYRLPDGIAAVIIVFLFQPLRARVQNFVDRKFFKIDFDYKTVGDKFIENIGKCLTAAELAALARKVIAETIPAESMNILLLSPSTGNFEQFCHDNSHPDSRIIHFIKDLCFHYPCGIPISTRKAFHDDVRFSESGGALAEINSEILFTSCNEDLELNGAILLGRKKSGFGFTVEDVALLSMIAAESGKALQRISLQRKLLFQQEEIQKLEELNELKSYFVSSVSHELKTPVTSIKLFTEIISSNRNLPFPQRNEYLGIINGECGRLERLVENILDFAKIERGSKEYRLARIDLNSAVDSVIMTMNYLIKIKNFNMIYEKNTANYYISGDEDALKEVIVNLIDNAVKYSSERREIEVRTYPSDSEYCCLVADKGIGISERDREKIFEPFFRSNDYNAGRVGGAGLGLSLVKSIVKAHRGRIELESTPGEGSTFKIYFPREGNQ